MSHPAELPLKAIQDALGPDNPIKRMWIQNPADGTNPKGKHGIRISVDTPRFVNDHGDGCSVWEASQDLIEKIKADRLCKCGHLKSECDE